MSFTCGKSDVYNTIRPFKTGISFLSHAAELAIFRLRKPNDYSMLYCGM